MSKNRQYQTLNEWIEKDEDEIELIDILRVIWNWKHLIIGGALICSMIAAITSVTMRKIYRVDMMLRPGIIGVDEKGKNVYIDSPQNIKALIESGKFNNVILESLGTKNDEKIQKGLNFSVEILAEPNTIIVKHETADLSQGVKIQNRLAKLLIREYEELVQHLKGRYDMNWNLLKNQIDLTKATIQSYKRNVKNIEKRNNELISEINIIKNNTANLVSEKNKLLSKNPKENEGLQISFYSYRIQQNIALTNNYLNKINDYKLEKEEKLRNILTLENDIELKLDEIKKLQLVKDNIQNIQILQAPTQNLIPIKPKTKLNIILAFIAGLFLMTLLAFCLEYLRTYKNKVRLNQNEK